MSQDGGKQTRNFNAIITNPPYAGSLHLDIFNRLLDNLEVCQGQTTGQMVIVEPSTWLINVRKNGKAKKYDAIKKKIAGHVKSVKIENLNKEFDIDNYSPLSITYMDFSQTYDIIEFECCGEVKKVKTLNDCNLIGSYDTIWSILNKVLAYGDMMDKHITNKDEGTGMWYSKYIDLNTYIGCIVGTSGKRDSLDTYGYYNGILGSYFSNAYFVNLFSNNVVNSIYNSIPKRLANGSNYTNPKYSDTNADCVYGTKEELENWKHFIFNNKLPLFINIVLTIDQHNNSKEFLPWLVDRQYTDEEIYAKFNLTQDEIALIDATLKKFERNSPWFKRYMCGEECEKTVNENRRRKNKR